MKECVNPTELTAELLNTLIEKIVVHEAVKGEDGSREQEVEIFYRLSANRMTHLEISNNIFKLRETGKSYPDLEMIKKISLLYNVRIEDLLEQENLTDLNRTKETAAKDFIPEKKYIAYFIVVAFLAISCMFSFFWNFYLFTYILFKP